MDLPAFIRSVGVDKAASLFEAKPRQVMAWLYGERKPRPEIALKIERLTKGKVRFGDIYTGGAMTLLIVPLEEPAPQTREERAARRRELRDELFRQHPRVVDVAARYQQGQTLEQIGFYYGITRERVRQILKRCGLTRLDGGAAYRTLLRCEDKKIARREWAERSEAASLRKYGMGREAIDDLAPFVRDDPRHPMRVFQAYRRNVRRCGYRFDLKFSDWWRIWQDSGCWEERGRGFGFWMARWDSNRGFTRDNLRIVRGSERSSDSYIIKPAAMRTAKRMRTLASKAKSSSPRLSAETSNSLISS